MACQYQHQPRQEQEQEQEQAEYPQQQQQQQQQQQGEEQQREMDRRIYQMNLMRKCDLILQHEDGLEYDNSGCFPCLPSCKKPVYRPGELVTGYLLLRPTRKQLITGFYVTFGGRADTSWTEERIHWSTRRVFYTESTTVIENRPIELDCKWYRFDFEYCLPRGLPTSFKASEGRITYYAYATVTRPRGEPIETNDTHYHIRGVLDIDCLSLRCHEPLQCGNTHVFSSGPGCVSSGPQSSSSTSRSPGAGLLLSPSAVAANHCITYTNRRTNDGPASQAQSLLQAEIEGGDEEEEEEEEEQEGEGCGEDVFSERDRGSLQACSTLDEEYVEVIVCLNSGAFVMRKDHIIINTTIINQTAGTISSTVALQQALVFEATCGREERGKHETPRYVTGSSSRVVSREVSTSDVEQVEAASTRSYTRVFGLPCLIPTTLKKYSLSKPNILHQEQPLIRVKYFIRITVTSDDTNESYSTPVEVTLGTYDSGTRLLASTASLSSSADSLQLCGTPPSKDEGPPSYTEEVQTETVT